MDGHDFEMESNICRPFIIQRSGEKKPILIASIYVSVPDVQRKTVVHSAMHDIAKCSHMTGSQRVCSKGLIWTLIHTNTILCSEKLRTE
jgi:hypothetical protein